MFLRTRGLQRCQQGAVYVEFLIAFLPVFLLFLGIVQLALVRAGQLVVREAAARACRTAIVILDDDPDRHGGLARGMLHGPPPPRGFFARVGEFFGIGSEPAQGADGSRLAAIRAAAYVPLAALAPPAEWAAGSLGKDAGDLKNAVTSSGTRMITGLAYNRVGAVVTLRAAPGSDDLASEPIAPDADVTVHVTYLYHCSVPLVSALVCRSLTQLLGGEAIDHALEDIASLREDPTRLGEVLENIESESDKVKHLARELARAEAPGALLGVLLGSGRFAVLEAEMTLPNQGARYHGGYGG